MKFFTLLLSVLLIICCKPNKRESMRENKSYSFYVGTYTDSESKGIYKYLLESDGYLKKIGLASISENPSFLAISADNIFLVAINEINNNGVGKVESFLILDDTLKFISSSTSGGAHPCFVTIDKAGYILAANYTGGNVGLLKLNTNGKLSELLYLQQHTGSGGTERQKAPHAHSAWFVPNSNNIISIDLGTNELFFSTIDRVTQKLIPSNQHKLKMAHGAGPRHLVFHPNGKWLYVVNELDCTVTILEMDKNTKWEIGVSVSTLPDGYSEPNTCADIHISKDGKFLYASNRGHNSIAIFSVNKDSGALNLIGHEPTLGNGPRSFALSPDNNYLLVANQHTKNIVSFKRNKESGFLQYISKIEAPTPVSILFNPENQ